MSVEIIDGSGKGYRASVDSDLRLSTTAVSESRFDNATKEGCSFNINTEFITVTNSTETPLLYLKNNEENDLIVEAWFIGTDASAGTATRLSLMKVYPNPTGGTIISGGTDVSIVNRSVGSTDTLDVDCKSGGDAFTLTTTTTPVLYQTQGSSSRAFGTVRLAIKKGSSIAVTMQMYGLTSLDIYTGFQVYKSK